MKFWIKRITRNSLISFAGICIIGVILSFAYITNKLFETILAIILFYVYRRFYNKQYHSKSLVLCAIISVLVFTFLTLLEFPKTTSVLSPTIFILLVTTISYVFKCYIDLKKKKVKTFNNISKEEMLLLLPNISVEKIEIVYEYIHRDKTIKAFNYAYNKQISEQTLYRYVREVKSAYKDLVE